MRIITSHHVFIFLQLFYMSSLSTKISSNIEAHPSKCCTFCKKKICVTRQGTKVPRVSLFNENKELLAYGGEKYFVLLDVVNSLGYKLLRNEKPSDAVNRLIVLVRVVWPELTVLSRKLPHEQTTALWAPLAESEANFSQLPNWIRNFTGSKKNPRSFVYQSSVFERSQTFTSLSCIDRPATCIVGPVDWPS